MKTQPSSFPVAVEPHRVCVHNRPRLLLQLKQILEGLGAKWHFVSTHCWCDSQSSEPSDPDQRRQQRGWLAPFGAGLWHHQGPGSGAISPSLWLSHGHSCSFQTSPMNLVSQRADLPAVLDPPELMAGHLLLGQELRGGGETDASTPGFILYSLNAGVAAAGVSKISLYMCRVRAGSLNFILRRTL